MEPDRSHARHRGRVRALQFLAPLFSCLLLFAACSGGDSSAESSPTSVPPTSSLSPASKTAFPTPPLNGAAFQAELLRDGLTEAEYERAVLTTLQCLVDRGGEYENLEWIEDRDKRQLVFWIVDRNSSGASIRAYDDCFEEYSALVEGAWTLQHEPSEEEFQERVEEYLQCMREAGYTDVFFGSDYAESLDDAGHSTRVECEQSAGLIAEPQSPPR